MKKKFGASDVPDKGVHTRLGQCCNRARMRGSNQAPLAVRSVDDEAFLWRDSHAACTKLPLGRVARPDPLMGF